MGGGQEINRGRCYFGYQAEVSGEVRVHRIRLIFSNYLLKQLYGNSFLTGQTKVAKVAELQENAMSLRLFCFDCLKQQ